MLQQQTIAKIETILRASLTTPSLFSRHLLNWTPHDQQALWLDHPRTLEEVLLTGRRWGKSETEAVKTLWYAMAHPGSKQMITSITLDQARIIWDEVVGFSMGSGLLSALMVDKPTYSPFPTIRWANGSKVEARSSARRGLYIRGHDFNRVVVDEADYLPDDVIDDVIRMTLADTAGTLVLTTTPKPKRSLVYRAVQAYRGGNRRVYVQHGASFENPHISHAFIEQMQERMTRGAWTREVLGQYDDEDSSVFRWSDIERAYSGRIWRWSQYNQDPRFKGYPKPGRRYVAGWDLARDVDWTVGVVLDVTQEPYVAVAFERFQRRPWPVVWERIRATHKHWDCSKTVYDATGIGKVGKDELGPVYRGYDFTARSKIDLIINAQLCFEKGLIQFPFEKQLVDELQTYAWDDKNIRETDSVMGLALALMAAGPRYAKLATIPNVEL